MDDKTLKKKRIQAIIAGSLGWLSVIVYAKIHLLPQNIVDKGHFSALLRTFAFFLVFSIFFSLRKSKRPLQPVKWTYAFVVCLLIALLIVF